MQLTSQWYPRALPELLPGQQTINSHLLIPQRGANGNIMAKCRYLPAWL